MHITSVIYDIKQDRWVPRIGRSKLKTSSHIKAIRLALFFSLNHTNQTLQIFGLFSALPATFCCSCHSFASRTSSISFFPYSQGKKKVHYVKRKFNQIESTEKHVKPTTKIKTKFYVMEVNAFQCSTIWSWCDFSYSLITADNKMDEN